MADLIKRDALMDHIELNAREYGEDYDAWQILGDVDDFPAVDAVEVVRCKDCRLSEESYFGDGWRYCRNNHHHHNDNHFCSYGERRADDAI